MYKYTYKLPFKGGAIIEGVDFGSEGFILTRRKVGQLSNFVKAGMVTEEEVADNYVPPVQTKTEEVTTGEVQTSTSTNLPPQEDLDPITKAVMES